MTTVGILPEACRILPKMELCYLTIIQYESLVDLILTFQQIGCGQEAEHFKK